MARQNVETLHGVYGALGRVDLDDAVGYLHHDCDLYPALWVPGGRSNYRGREGARELFELIIDPWATMTVAPTEVIEVGDDRLLAVERWQMRGREDIKLDTELTEVYAFREGLIVRLDGFREKAKALAAVGLTA